MDSVRVRLLFVYTSCEPFFTDELEQLVA